MGASMTLSASGAQVSQFQTRVSNTPPVSYSTIRDRTAPLEIVTPRRRTLMTTMESAKRIALSSEDASPVQLQTTEQSTDDTYVKMDSHVDYYYENLEIWGVRTWVRAWIPNTQIAVCNRPYPVGCRLIVVVQEYTMNLQIPETTFQLDYTAVIPIPQLGAYATDSKNAIWVRVPITPLSHNPYLRFPRTLVGVTIAASVVGDNRQSCSRIHAHAVWPGGTSYVTSFKGC